MTYVCEERSGRTRLTPASSPPPTGEVLAHRGQDSGDKIHKAALSGILWPDWIEAKTDIILMWC